MRTVGAYEAKTHLAELLDEVEKGGAITIARHGRGVARLVPARSAKNEDRRAAVTAIRGFAAAHRLRGLKLRRMIEEGRR